MVSMTDDAARRRVLLFGTHPNQFNGYSKVVYNLMRRLECWRGADNGDLQLFIHGFQNFYNNTSHDRVLEHTKIYDAHHFENPKAQGFGFAAVKQVYTAVRPHLCIVYNDSLVVSNIVKEIVTATQETRWRSKLVVYVDQVYDCQKLEYINLLNAHADAVVAFTASWKSCMLDQGLRNQIPMYVLPHGFDPTCNYPVPKKLARRYLGLDPTDFLVYNANRNQPRKRWDVCIMAFAEVVRRHLGEPIKLVVGTTRAEGGSWNLVELLQFEFRRLGVPLDQGMRHVVFVENPQVLTDQDINAMYNATDIGLNTCDGEGFGLCNFEHAAVGRAQVVPRVGGFRDVFDDAFSIMVEPKLRLYVDASRDHVGGMCQICDPLDFADAIERYYLDRDLCETHGRLARQHMIQHFQWDAVARTYEKIVDLTLPGPDQEQQQQDPPVVPESAAVAASQGQSPTSQGQSETTTGRPHRAAVKRKCRKHPDVDAEIKLLSDRLKSLLSQKEETRRRKKVRSNRQGASDDKNENG